MSETGKTRLVNVDSKRRVSLGWTQMKSDFYAVTVEPDGTIILTPVHIDAIEKTHEQEDS